MSRCCDDRLISPCDPASLWQRNPSMRAPLDQRAISMASRTMSVRMCDATRQPTMARE